MIFNSNQLRLSVTHLTQDISNKDDELLILE